MSTPGIVTICGKPASGKTVLMARCLAIEWAHGAPVVMFDPTGDLSKNMRDTGVPADKLEPVESDVAVSTGRKILERWDDNPGAFGNTPPIVVLYPSRPQDLQQLAERWLYLAGDMIPGTVYACDEAETLFPNQPHSQAGVGPSRAALLQLARNRNVRVYLATKRPQRIHLDARENAMHVCVFRSDSDGFLEGCRNFGRIKDYDSVRELDVGEYVYRGPFTYGKTLPILNSLDDELPFEPLHDQNSHRKST